VLTGVRRLLGVALVALPASLAVAVPAGADKGPIVVTPGDYSGAIDTTVTDPGRAGRPGHGPAVRSAGGSATVTCRYYKAFYDVSTPGGRMVDLGGPARTARGSGQWWLRLCSDGSREVVFVPVGTDPNAVPAAATPAELALRAFNRLRLPVPVVGFSPARRTSVGPATTVHVPTWWWVRDWSPRRQRTAAGAVWAIVTARPVQSVWVPGDGGPRVTCGGSGRQAAVTTATPDCSSMYAASSAVEPGQVYRASVTVVWQVTWAGAGGTAGVLPPLRMTASFPVAVMERQSVVVGVGGGR
jgi:hypothetical protein